MKCKRRFSYNDEKKVLIIGESDSVFIKEYVENILKENKKIQFSILTNSIIKYRKFYMDNHVKLIYMPQLYIDKKEWSIYSKCVLWILKHQYDYVHVQAVGYNQLEKAVFIADNKSKLIISYWAHPTGKREINDVGKLLKYVHKISFVTDSLKKEFQENYGHEFDEKIFCIKLYSGGFERLRDVVTHGKLANLRKISKKKMNIPSNRVSIALGYCARKDQQHIRVLRELQKLSDDELKNIYLYIHVAYGTDDRHYIRQIEMMANKLSRRGCICEVSQKFMTGNRLACLRLAMDVFINVELQDALSATMQEYICAGSMVLNGDWLDYHDLDQYGIHYTKILGLNDLSVVLSKIIEKPIVIDGYNSFKIKQYRSWGDEVHKWIELYNE
ncbi:MAG: hypothetical protein J6A03_00760 [Lachnospiraceae bacterium]|nr:hypothetical protein [Lachnospiraceae bacterium]